MVISQSRIESLIESWANIGSGFIISYLMWVFVVGPLWNLETTPLDNLGIVTLFTVTSVIRSYVWRRWFNAKLHRRLEHAFNNNQQGGVSQ